MRTLEEQERIEQKRAVQRIEEQLTDAWYVTLIGSDGLFGQLMPWTQFVRELARRRNLRRLGLDPDREVEITMVGPGRAQIRNVGD